MFSSSVYTQSSTIDQDDLRRKCLTFQAGFVSQHSRNWELLTSDPVILDAIKHYHIEFEADFPKKNHKT